MNKASDPMNASKMCRLCLVDGPEEDMVEIFDSNEVSLTVRILACAGLDVTRSDALPKQICVSCRLSLEESYLFRNRCKNSDSKLRRHFRLLNAGKRSRVFDESDDECDDKYAESVRVICELKEKLKPAPKVRAQRPTRSRNKGAQKQPKQDDDKAALAALPDTSGRVTLSAGPAQEKAKVVGTETDDALTGDEIEILVEDVDDPACEYEYIITDPNDDFHEIEELSMDDDVKSMGDEASSETPAASNDLDELVDESQHAGASKLDALDEDDEEADDMDDAEDMDYLEDEGEQSSQAKLLTSLLPAIRKSVAEKSGMILDDDTEYKILGQSDGELRISCTTSDGKEFEIELITEGEFFANEFERDENGDWKIFKCSKCPKTFARRGKLINHERDHMAKTIGQECPYCQKWFPSNSTLQRHIRVHTGEKPFKCDICNRSFIQKEILKRHQMIHSGERPFKCELCSRSFILKDALRQHFNRNHSKNPTTDAHHCPFCSKSFCHSSGLSRHLLIHAGRTFACSYCHKKFNDKSALKRHTISIHNVTFDSSHSTWVKKENAKRELSESEQT